MTQKNKVKPKRRPRTCPSCGILFTYKGQYPSTFCSRKCVGAFLSWLRLHPRFGRLDRREQIGRFKKHSGVKKGKPAPQVIAQPLMPVAPTLVYRAVPAQSVPKHSHLKRHEDGGYVYLVQAGELTKIGKATDYRDRIANIKTSCPLKTCLLFVIEAADNNQLEKLLHHQFHSKRVRGEWFRLSEEDIAYVKQDHYDNLACFNGRIVGAWKPSRGTEQVF